MGDELKRYRWYYNGMLPDSSGGLCKYEDAAAAIEQLQAQLAQARSECVSAFKWLSDVRFALGDDGKRMLPELVEFAKSLVAELAQARERLPEGMEHCTIRFIECEKGHGRLTATNWVQHGCIQCELQQAREQVERHATDYNTLRDRYDGLVADMNQAAQKIAAAHVTEQQLRDRLAAMRGYMESRASAPKRSHWENFIALNPEYAPEQPPSNPAEREP